MFVIVTSSDKIILKNIVPKIAVAEYNKMILTPPNDFNVMTKNSVIVLIPTNTRNDIRKIKSKLMLNGMLQAQLANPLV